MASTAQQPVKVGPLMVWGIVGAIRTVEGPFPDVAARARSGSTTEAIRPENTNKGSLIPSRVSARVTTSARLLSVNVVCSGSSLIVTLTVPSSARTLLAAAMSSSTKSFGVYDTSKDTSASSVEMCRGNQPACGDSNENESVCVIDSNASGPSWISAQHPCRSTAAVPG